MLKPELDAAVFGGEGVTFFSKSNCLSVFLVFVARCRDLTGCNNF